MHSAQRAKLRRQALEDRMRSDQVSSSLSLTSSQSLSSFPMAGSRKGFGSSSTDRRIVGSSSTDRKGSDRFYPSHSLGKTNARNTFEGSVARSRTHSGNGRGINGGGPDSDSGLSGFEADESKRDGGGRESKTESAVDSGRRTQSLENLSEDLASVSLSSPVSTPSPRPPMLTSEMEDPMSEAGGKSSSKSYPRGHVHFLPNENVNQVHLSSNGLNHISSYSGDGRLPRSSSIPVHLTVSSLNCENLPVALRPDSSLSIGQHEPGCALMNESLRRPSPLLLSSSRGTFSSSPSINGGTLPRRGATASSSRTPSRTRTFSTSSTTSSSRARANSALAMESRCSSSNGTAFRSSTLPRRSTSSSSLATTCSSTMSSRAKASTIVTPAGSQRSFDGDHDFEASTPIAAGRATPTLKQPLRGRRRPLRTPKFLNTSMEIWEIQKQLKRGEMVQGVLQIGGGGPTHAFGSRVPDKEEPCICAPVTIGRTSGHMDWRCM